MSDGHNRETGWDTRLPRHMKAMTPEQRDRAKALKDGALAKIIANGQYLELAMEIVYLIDRVAALEQQLRDRDAPRR